MAAKRIAVYGLSANPPGMHHLAIVNQLVLQYDKVIVVPCGFRPDKATTNDIPPLFRAAMTDMTFGHLSDVVIDLTDLEKEIFTRSHVLVKRFVDQGEVHLIVGSDLIQGGKEGQSHIQREWENGEELWRTANFGIIPRIDCDIQDGDLPPNGRIVANVLSGSSTEIRERVFRHEDITDLVTHSVRQYIERYALYRGMQPARNPDYNLDEPRLMLVIDERNEKAKRMAAKLDQFSSSKSPDLIAVCGGDGTMLRAIREHWRKRLPFIGINAGHYGFLLNDFDEADLGRQIFSGLMIRHSPMLYVQSLDHTNARHEYLAFNDCWTRSVNGGQSAWTEISINGEVVIKKMVSDGVLICTASGSTSYARAMGATPMNVGASEFMLVGNNVFMPPFWRPVHLNPTDEVILTPQDIGKRAVDAYVDGIPLGTTQMMLVRQSRIAAVELLFQPQYDTAAKLRKIQFPDS